MNYFLQEYMNLVLKNFKYTFNLLLINQNNNFN